MKFGKTIVLVVPLILALLASSASATTGCAGAPAASAINQYCETFPGSTGSQSPKPGGPSLGSTLPARIVHQLVGSGAGGAMVVGQTGGAPASSANSASGKAHADRHAARASGGLLSIPAAAIHRSEAPLRAASTSAWSLYGSLLVGLVIATLALAVATVLIAHRRQRSDS